MARSMINKNNLPCEFWKWDVIDEESSPQRRNYMKFIFKRNDITTMR